MELKIFSPQEAAYRRNTLIYFYVFGVIGSDTAFDHIDNGWLVEKEIIVPPIQSPFLTVSLTKQGTLRCKQWVNRQEFKDKRSQHLLKMYDFDATS